jgi:hypothetical protein
MIECEQITGPPPSKTCRYLGDFHGRQGDAYDFGRKGREIDAGRDNTKVVQPTAAGKLAGGWESGSTPWQGGAMTPLKDRAPPPAPWFFPDIGAAHAHRTVQFFALVLRSRLHVTAPSVMRNGSPRKKVGASTSSSSGPAMKTCLISKCISKG